MTFGCNRKSLGQKSIQDEWEMLRFCSKLNTIIIGGASKLFKYFIDNYRPKIINSYCDISRFEGGTYQNLGFKLSHISEPNYYYIIDGIRQHRFNWRKDKLVKLGYDINKTELEIMSELGYNRIFDCGNQKWIYNI